MDKFLTQEGLDLIATLLVLGAIGFALFYWGASYLERSDKLWIDAHPLDTAPEDRPAPTMYVVDPTNVDQILAHMGISEQDRADIARGTKL